MQQRPVIRLRISIWSRQSSSPKLTPRTESIHNFWRIIAVLSSYHRIPTPKSVSITTIKAILHSSKIRSIRGKISNGLLQLIWSNSWSRKQLTRSHRQSSRRWLHCRRRKRRKERRRQRQRKRFLAWLPGAPSEPKVQRLWQKHLSKSQKIPLVQS